MLCSEIKADQFADSVDISSDLDRLLVSNSNEKTFSGALVGKCWVSELRSVDIRLRRDHARGSIRADDRLIRLGRIDKILDGSFLTGRGFNRRLLGFLLKIEKRIVVCCHGVVLPVELCGKTQRATRVKVIAARRVSMQAKCRATSI